MEERLTSKDYKNEISNIILDNINSINLHKLLDKYHPYDLSRVILELEEDTIKNLFENFPEDFSAEIFEYFSVEEVQDLMQLFSKELVAIIISLMDLDLSVDLIKGLKKQGIELLNKIEKTRRRQILKIMKYTEYEIGSYLNDSFLTLDINCSVKEAMKQVINLAHETDYISLIYILDNNELVGYIKLKDLIVARADENISDIVESRFPKVYPEDNIEYVAKIMQETKESSLPIITKENHIIGVVTHDDLMDIITLAEEEDYTKFAGLSDFDSKIESFGVLKSVKSRLPWLSILLLLSMITSFILSFFDDSLSGSAPLLAAKLAVFLPLILDMAGNTGTQSLAVTIRYLTKNDNPSQTILKKMIYREIRTGIMQGLLIGIIVIGMILLTNLTTKGYLENIDYIYAIVTSGSIFVALIISTTLGGLIPIIMTKLKIDPAVASGPFITTISDIITLTIYYTISMAILLPLF
ncbi:MAG: magnesium transporter [Candidatus Izimaplasma sp.]|nr:magnesium transporter [Candidatus Izimaplasma bacterium]